MAGRIHKFPQLYWPQQYFMNTALLKLGMVHSEIPNNCIMYSVCAELHGIVVSQ